MKKLLKWLDQHFEESILAVLLFVMMMIMGIQVTARYIFSNSLSWSEEITRFCFIWTGFLSISYCIRNNASIKIEQFVDLFKNAADGKVVQLLHILEYVIEGILFLYLLPYAYHYVYSAYISKASSPAVGIPMWIIEGITIISFVLCEVRILQLLVKTIRDLYRKKRGV